MTLSAVQLERCMIADLDNEDWPAFLDAFRIYHDTYPVEARMAADLIAELMREHQVTT